MSCFCRKTWYLLFICMRIAHALTNHRYWDAVMPVRRCRLLNPSFFFPSRSNSNSFLHSYWWDAKERTFIRNVSDIRAFSLHRSIWEDTFHLFAPQINYVTVSGSLLHSHLVLLNVFWPRLKISISVSLLPVFIDESKQSGQRTLAPHVLVCRINWHNTRLRQSPECAFTFCRGTQISISSYTSSFPFRPSHRNSHTNEPEIGL